MPTFEINRLVNGNTEAGNDFTEAELEVIELALRDFMINPDNGANTKVASSAFEKIGELL